MKVQIEFEVSCKTNLGEVVVICGNLPELGHWVPEKGLRLTTDQLNFPYWTTDTPLEVIQGTTIEFKLCLLDEQGNLVRWEQVQRNRSFCPKNSLLIQFQESEGVLMLQVTNQRRFSDCELQVTNIRKGTEEVINDLASDSSSNRDMWKEHKFPEDEEGSWLLNQFVFTLGKLVSTQQEQGVIHLEQQPQMQQQNQITFPSNEYSINRNHFLITELHPSSKRTSFPNNTVYFTSSSNLSSLCQKHSDELIIFHALQQKQHQQILKTRHLIEKTQEKRLRSLLILHWGGSIQGVNFDQADIVVCQSVTSLSELVEFFERQGHRITSSGNKEFVVMKDKTFILKLLLEQRSENALLQNVDTYMNKVISAIQNFHFPLHQNDFRRQISLTLESLRFAHYHCLIVLHLNRLEELSLKSIGDLVQLSSLKHDILVVVVLHEIFPKNIKDRVPASNNNLLILNTSGQIYFNSNDPIDLFKYVQICKNKFEENMQMVIDKVEPSLLKIREWTPKRVCLEIENTVLENITKQWLVKCVRKVNKKSIAKLILNTSGNVVTLVPFVLHPNFLLKTVLTSFAGIIKGNEKGLILSIEAKNISNMKWLEPPEGREVNLEYCRFRLKEKEERYCYESTPLGDNDMRELLDVISYYSEERTKVISEEEIIE